MHAVPEVVVTAPAHLAAPTAEWYRQVCADWALDEHHLRLLQLAAEAWDRAQEARAILADEGITYMDRFGAPRMHPAVPVERDSRLAFARLVRELDLDALPEPSQFSLRGRRRG